MARSSWLVLPRDLAHLAAMVPSWPMVRSSTVVPSDTATLSTLLRSSSLVDRSWSLRSSSILARSLLTLYGALSRSVSLNALWCPLYHWLTPVHLQHHSIRFAHIPWCPPKCWLAPVTCLRSGRMAHSLTVAPADSLVRSCLLVLTIVLTRSD